MLRVCHLEFREHFAITERNTGERQGLWVFESGIIGNLRSDVRSKLSRSTSELPIAFAGQRQEPRNRPAGNTSLQLRSKFIAAFRQAVFLLDDL